MIWKSKNNSYQEGKGVFIGWLFRKRSAGECRSRFNPRSEWMVNGGSTKCTTDISVAPSKKNCRFFWLFIVVKQCFRCDIIYHFQQIRFACNFAAWRKYVHWFKTASIIFYIIFDPCMNHYEYFPFALNLTNLYLPKFHHMVVFLE